MSDNYEEKREILFDFILQDKDKNILRTGKFTFDEILNSCGDDFIYEQDMYYLNGDLIEDNIEDWISDFKIIAKRQSTGCKDSKGNIIMEDDVVKRTRHNKSWEIPTIIDYDKVSYKAPSFCAFDLYLGDFVGQELEVVGNKYENKELLK